MADVDNKKQIHCPECENDFDYDISSVEIGDIIECPVCGANLEIASIEPLVVESVTTYK
jgi:alpha-aminoadipate/glutamate carrier protein LysW